MSAGARRWPLFVAVLAFFFVSGGCGLLYQVVWTRKLVLLFGTTSYAVSTVLCIFFLGLAAGSLWGGRIADRARSPLQWYGWIEIAVGLWALAFLLLVRFGEDAVVILLQQFAASRGAGVALRAAMAMALLFVPVALMGATLPLLSKFASHDPRARGLRVGALYSINTLGAVAGCFAAGFVLVPAYGYTRSTLIGAGANIAVGIIALLLARPAAHADTETATPVDVPPLDAATRRLAAYSLAAFALTGFCSLALEVIWTRLLAIIFLGTTYAYTTMLTVLLCGIALGSLAASLAADRLRAPALWLGAALLATGVFTLLQLDGFARMPAALLEGPQADWNASVQQKFWLAAWILFPPTFALGATFPLVVKIVSAGQPRLGRDVGRIYAFNTFGGVAGSLAGGFLLLPWLGAHASMAVLGLMLCVGGAALAVVTPASAVLRGGVLALGATGACAAFWLAPVDVNAALNVGYVPASHQVLSVREGTEGTVVVTEPESEPAGTNRVLWINRVQATATIEKGVKMNRLQGALPLLFDRDPDRVLFMCFGSGITCGTLALSDFERIDAVEISPDVIASAALFEEDNLGVLRRPALQVHIDDGRNYLLTSTENYDFITFEPMPLALAGVSTFYTREYYELCYERMTPGGMTSQWIPLHSLSPDVVKALARTFIDVFPHHCAWFINADLFLIGSNEPLQLDYAKLTGRLQQPELKAALADVGFHDAAELLASFAMDGPALRAFAGEGPVMSDDRPWAEFEAPKLVYAELVDESLLALEPHFTSPLSLLPEGSTTPEIRAGIERRHLARAHDFKGLLDYYGVRMIGGAAYKLFAESLAIDPENWNSKYYIKQIAEQQAPQLIRWEMWDEARELIGTAHKWLPDDPAIAALQAALEAEGRGTAE
jgi:spermidine synthase